MRTILRLLIPAVAICITACSDSDSNSADTATENNAPVAPAPAPVTAPVTAPTVTNTAPVNTGSQTTAINPAHGEPGHRCDIAVGSPLNSAPGTGQNVAPQPVPQTISAPTSIPAPVTTAPTPVTPTPAPTTTAPGTNPAHGQPGHDCSIAVGAPLKTK